MENLYAIVYQDQNGLWYLVRNEVISIPNADVVAVFKGSLLYDVSMKAKDFVKNNKGKQLNTLPPQEISDLL